MHVLVVEDDHRLRRLLTRLLAVDRHVVEEAPDAQTALELARMADGLDAIILDIGLPDRSGLEVAKELRSHGSSVPILMLTARDAVDDRVRGLDSGADDYLVKPFAYEELSARLRALGRRARNATRKTARLANGPIVLDEAMREVTVGGRTVGLSPREFSLLECFLRHPGQALTRDQLLDAAWPYGVAVTPNTVDAYVHLLREKLGREGGARIHTERGVGYRMLAPDRRAAGTA
jgi:DNA-binding response OmpR family regulator